MIKSLTVAFTASFFLSACSYFSATHTDSTARTILSQSNVPFAIGDVDISRHDSIDSFASLDREQEIKLETASMFGESITDNKGLFIAYIPVDKANKDSEQLNKWIQTKFLLPAIDAYMASEMVNNDNPYRSRYVDREKMIVWGPICDNASAEQILLADMNGVGECNFSEHIHFNLVTEIDADDAPFSQHNGATKFAIATATWDVIATPLVNHISSEQFFAYVPTSDDIKYNATVRSNQKDTYKTFPYIAGQEQYFLFAHSPITVNNQ